MSKEQSIEEAAEKYANETNGFLNERQADYEHSKRDFIAGAEWSEQSKWIPVAERLPEKHGYYIVAYNGFQGKYVICVEYSTQYNEFSELNNDITHWQPLPNPPKR